ncbi:peptidyl-prolyl cis-trans isomerase CYP21-4 [Phoenix dactylifera]|uniref:Peptidyl-prolyl cis-trans isomerase n=1 Tax=Phoenix dactylifera TaxID=42345 RepID=A0A8B7CQP9_PHODC|nr:peptidyl-prolyl cis-trans isomerase CYP21-4 [Phoenix dactylifera]
MARIKPQALLQQSKRKKGPTRICLTTVLTCKLVVILIVLSLYATYKHWYRRSSDELRLDLHNFEHSEAFGESKKYNLPSYAILNTAKGSITMELDKDASPDVVGKFVELCQKGYFKTMPFHHVIKNYVIQGGHSQRIGAAEDWILKRKSHSQLAISPKHEAFMIGTTVANSDDKGFELFITTAPIPDLSDKLLVFGRVIKGEDVVQEIEEVDTDEHYRPKSPVGIIDVTLKQEL